MTNTHKTVNQPTSALPADAEQPGWIARLPKRAQPFALLMRLDRPIGIWLLVLPTWWGLALGARDAQMSAGQFILYAALFFMGALIMRGAGCAFNDIVDRDFDAKVARTARRPIPAGLISVRSAFIFTLLLCALGLLILVQFNLFTILVGASALILVAIYPFMKRITYWPQAWLGLTFNWGVLVGFASASGTLSWAAIALYAAGVFWTLGYDTIYAHQDTDDDALIGVKSTALRLGRHTHKWLTGFYGLTILLFGLSGILSNAGTWYFVLLIPAILHLTWQTNALNIDDSASCLKLFRANRSAGFLFLTPLMLELLIG